MDKIIVTVIGVLSIFGIYWFFFGKKEEAVDIGESLKVIVDGGYKPNILRIKQGKPVRLTFIRKDANSCLEEILFPDYKIKEYLPLNQPVTIILSPPHPNVSSFNCSMNMFHGRIETQA